MRRRNIPAQSEQQHHEMLLRPPEKTCLQKVSDFVWDRQNKTCLTRTPINWLAISVYYFFFLVAVILIFYLSMLAADFISSQNHGRPQYILEDSPIGSSPSLNFFPMSGSRPLIWLSEERSYKKYVDIIKKVFEQYKKANNSFNTKAYGDCSKPPFGYDTKSPCIFFRLNRLIMWKPTPFKKGDTLPKDMPEEVKAMISSSSSPKIWMSCNGTTAKDRDHITPNFFHFQGKKGFDPSAFPFDGQKYFVDPIVALKFSDSQPRKVLYSFTCTAWSKTLDTSATRVDVTYYFE